MLIIWTERNNKGRFHYSFVQLFTRRKWSPLTLREFKPRRHSAYYHDSVPTLLSPCPCGPRILKSLFSDKRLSINFQVAVLDEWLHLDNIDLSTMSPSGSGGLRELPISTFLKFASQ